MLLALFIFIIMLDQILEEENILKIYDDYSIFSYYLGFEPEFNKAYHSPLRNDDDIPSFSIWKSSSGKILFKDFATGQKGDVFKFVSTLYGYTSILDTLSKINVDLDLGLIGGKEMPINGRKIAKIKQPKQRKLINIEILSKIPPDKRFILFWEQYGIKDEVLKMYNVTQVDTLKLTYDTKITPIYPKRLTIAYRIGKQYQIYSPKEDNKPKQFINNFSEDIMFGEQQIKNPKFIIITKSFKEIMFFRQHFNWNTVSPRSESTMLSRRQMLRLLKFGVPIYVWFDNDIAGIKFQNEYVKEYPFLKPIRYKAEYKDPTDNYRFRDKQKVLTEIKNLIK